MPAQLTIKELHAHTGVHVRRAGKSRSPIVITDRGLPVAVLTSLSALAPRKRTRTFLPEFEALMAREPGDDVLDDLNSIRGDR
jgi:prevent-host-death family protein